jgi:anti-anti-sigma regulatory factor
MSGIGDIRVERGGGDLWIMSLSGEHDFSNVADLDEALRQVHTHGTRVVLDFSEASFIDSSVIASVVREARDDARKPGDDLAVVAPAGSQPRRVLELVHVECVRIVESCDDAIRAIRVATVSGDLGPGRS